MSQNYVGCCKQIYDSLEFLPVGLCGDEGMHLQRKGRKYVSNE